MRAYLLVLLTVLVTGCASQPRYMRYVNNTGATQDQFMKDRYSCYQETRERVSAAYANQYGGAASSQVVPSCSGFNACMAARGYYRVADTTDVTVFQQRGNYYVPGSAMLQCSN